VGRRMTTKNRGKELDVVKLLVDLPDYGLSKGQEGTILVVTEDPSERYLVEFSDEEGDEIATVDLAPDQVDVIWSFAEHQAKESQPPEQTPESIAKTYFEQGMIYLNNGLLDQAKEKFRRTFEINPDYAGTLLNAAKPLADEGQWDKAVFICRLVLALQ